MNEHEQLEDLELERRAAGGDRDAFGVLYERHCDAVHDYLMYMLRNAALADDLMQDTFVKAMRYLSEERAGAASFRTRLRSIAHGLAVNWLEKKESKNRPLATPTHDDDGDQPNDTYFQIDPDRLENPGVAVEVQDMARLVWEAAEMLDPKQRSLLVLHVRDGMTSAEIARELSVKENNAYVMVNRLKAQFESALAALVMFRAGRRKCANLDGLLREQSTDALSPQLRRVVDGHVRTCETCTGERKRLVSASALLRALVLLGVPFALRRRGAEAAWEAYCAESASPPAGGQGGAGPGGVRLAGGGLREVIAGSTRRLIATGTIAAVVLLAAGTCAAVPGAGGAGVDRLSAVLGVGRRPTQGPSGPGIGGPGPRSASTPSAVSPATEPPPPALPTPVPPSPLPIATVEPTPTSLASPVATAEAVASPVPTTGPPPAGCPASQPPLPVVFDAAQVAGFAAAADQYRTRYGLPPLLPNSVLQVAADKYARFFVSTRRSQDLANLRPDPSGVNVIHLDEDCEHHQTRAVAAGYPYTWVGENVRVDPGSMSGAAQFAALPTNTRGWEDPARLKDGAPLFVAYGLSCYRLPSYDEIGCVQVMGAVP